MIIFAVAAITDAYDGHLARKYNQITSQGKFLDPLADKILVLSAFFSYAFIGIIDFWMVGIITFRDMFITGLRWIISNKGFEFVQEVLRPMVVSYERWIEEQMNNSDLNSIQKDTKIKTDLNSI